MAEEPRQEVLPVEDVPEEIPDRPEPTLADIYAALDEMNGRLIVIDTVLAEFTHFMRRYVEGQTRLTWKEVTGR